MGGSARLDHMQGGDALGTAVRPGQAGIDYQAIAVFHERNGR